MDAVAFCGGGGGGVRIVPRRQIGHHGDAVHRNFNPKVACDRVPCQLAALDKDVGFIFQQLYSFVEIVLAAEKYAVLVDITKSAFCFFQHGASV